MEEALWVIRRLGNRDKVMMRSSTNYPVHMIVEEYYKTYNTAAARDNWHSAARVRPSPQDIDRAIDLMWLVYNATAHLEHEYRALENTVVFLHFSGMGYRRIASAVEDVLKVKMSHATARTICDRGVTRIAKYSQCQQKKNKNILYTFPK